MTFVLPPDIKGLKHWVENCCYKQKKHRIHYLQMQPSRGVLKVFIGKAGLKICSKFTGKHPCQSAVSIKLQRNFIEITFRHWCSPVNLLHIFRTPLLKNTSGRLLLYLSVLYSPKKLTNHSNKNYENISQGRE